MDPVFSGADYNEEHLLRKMYDEQKANEYIKMYIKMYKEIAARPQTGYRVVQSRD
jgi:hypothetical protein